MACATIDFTNVGDLAATSFPDVNGLDRDQLYFRTRDQL